jgi:excisionase family DNA binding protein
MSTDPMIVTLTAEQLRDIVRAAVREELAATRSNVPAAMLTPSEVAKALRLSTRHVRNLLAEGELPAVRVGSRWRVKRTDVDAYLAGRRDAA